MFAVAAATTVGWLLLFFCCWWYPPRKEPVPGPVSVQAQGPSRPRVGLWKPRQTTVLLVQPAAVARPLADPGVPFDPRGHG